MRGRVQMREFKLEDCRQIAPSEKRPALVCREHERASSLLARWRKEFEQYGDGALLPGPKTEPEAAERRVAELERFCGQLAWENAVLQRALETVTSIPAAVHVHRISRRSSERRPQLLSVCRIATLGIVKAGRADLG
jgi:transposase